MNNLLKFFRDAFTSLTSNKMRTFLTMLGIVIGVASVISMLAIGQGASASITESIESIGTNVIFIKSGNEDVTNPKPLTLSDASALMEADLQFVASVAPSVERLIEVSNAGNSTSAQLYGVTPEYANVRNEEINFGSFITDDHVTNRSTVAVIGFDIAEDLLNTSSNVVGNKIRIGSYLYTVIGILESKGGSAMGSSDNQIFIPITTAQTRLISKSSTRDAVNLISVQSSTADNVATASQEVSLLLQNRHGILNGEDLDFTIFTQEAFTEAATSITQIMTVFLGGVGAISLLVGGIGIMNIMLVTVVERTKEIGLRKAVGARKSDILIQFMIESLVIGLVGGILGILLGAGISSIVKSVAAFGNMALNPQITASSVLLATLFSICVGLVFGIYPANRAANLEPVEALRTE